MARIRRVDCSGPGIRPRRRGRSFSYTDAGGEAVTDPEDLARIRGLGIPPAWKDVWICPIPTGHLQAVGTWVDVRSDDINDYIKEQTGGDFTAKDFRTWSATVLASVALASSFPQGRSRTARARAISRAVKEVGHYLGNTPAVCRASYIDPRLFDRYRSGLTIAGALTRLGEVEELGEPAHQGPIEEAVLDLIEERRAPAPELDLIA
jgi:DNA topoisomerase IB